MPLDLECLLAFLECQDLSSRLVTPISSHLVQKHGLLLVSLHEVAEIEHQPQIHDGSDVALLFSFEVVFVCLLNDLLTTKKQEFTSL